MALGIFTGMGLEVKAADTIEKTLVWCLDFDCIWTSLGTGVEAGTNYIVKGQQDNGNEVQFHVYLFYSSEGVDTTNLKTSQDIEPCFMDFISRNIPGNIVNNRLVTNYDFTVETHDNISKWDIQGILVKNDDESFAYFYILLTPAKSSTSESSSSSTEQSGASTQPPHTHSYSWVTVQEAGPEQDGIEEYRCSCGDVQERNVIPASEVLVKGLFGEIKDAPLNGSTTFDTGRQYTLSDYIIRKLSERTDVTTVITFEYEGQPYRMTIPAGADYSQLLADEDYFYGYFYFANAVGATIEAL